MAGRRPALTGKARDESGERERASPLPCDPVLERTDVPPDGQHTRDAQLRVTTLAQLSQGPLFRRRPIGHRLI